MIKNNTWSEPSMRIALAKNRNDDRDNDYSNATATAAAPESPSRIHDPAATSLTNSLARSRLSPVPINIDNNNTASHPQSLAPLPLPLPQHPPPPSALHARSYQSRPDHEPPSKRPRLSDDEEDELAEPALLSGAHTTMTATTTTIGQTPRLNEAGSGSYKLENNNGTRNSRKNKSQNNKDSPGSNSPSIDITTSSALTRPTRASLRFRQPQPQTQTTQAPQQLHDQHPASVPGPEDGLHDVDMQSSNNGGNDERTPVSISGGAGGEINVGRVGLGGGGGDDGERKTKVKDKSYINRQNVVGGEKRSLRSHDGGSRSKSELAMYFSNYEQVIALEPVKREFLSADTTISVVNDLTEPVQLEPSSYQPQEAPNPLINLHNAQTIDLSPSDSSTPTLQTLQPGDTDPLDDAYYFKPHRRLERQEKQLRNIEKERAQHEKGQLEHLLDELKGHDWLRVMGISGVTDTDKKLYLPKRDYFIGEVTSLLGKFKAWKKAKGLRLWERGRRSSIARGGKTGDEETGEEEEEEEKEGEGEEDDAGGPRGHPSSKKHPRSDDNSATTVPDADDVDAWAARQLHQEALSASQNDHLHPHPHTSDHTVQPPPSSSQSFPPKQPAPTPHTITAPAPAPLPDLWTNKPFTSFYSKPHLRQAAVKRDKRSRARVAFGEPVPEVAQAEFQLPDSILTPEAIRAAQRRNRRLRREVGKKG